MQGSAAAANAGQCRCCIHIYIHTYTHTYIHTYIHTYRHTNNKASSQVDRRALPRNFCLDVPAAAFVLRFTLTRRAAEEMPKRCRLFDDCMEGRRGCLEVYRRDAAAGTNPEPGIREHSGIAIGMPSRTT